MRVRQGDVSRILMDSKHKGFPGLGEIAPHLLDPLSRLERMERNDAVSRIL